MTHTQTIPNLIVIDKDWLDKEIETLKKKRDNTVPFLINKQFDKFKQDNIDTINWCGAKLSCLELILAESSPLKPIVEDAWLQGKKNNVMWANDKEYEVLKQNYLSQPIKLEK